MKLKRIASAFLAGALALSLAACGGSASTSAAASASGSAAGSTSAAAGSDLDYIKGKGKMVIGYTVYEPMNYTDADGNFTGFDSVDEDNSIVVNPVEMNPQIFAFHIFG